MIRFNHLRAAVPGQQFAQWLLCCLATLTCALPSVAQTEAQPQTSQSQPPDAAAQQVPSQATPQAGLTQPGEGSGTGTTAVEGGHSIEPVPGKRQLREAEDAYLAGAKRLERDDLDAAESEFQRALKLDPANRTYAVAISVTREHRLTELVQQATKARQAGDESKAQSLLAEARTIDPDSPVVAEHSGLFFATRPVAPQAVTVTPNPVTPDSTAPALEDRAKLIANAEAYLPTIQQAPVLAGAIHITPTPGLKSFHLRGVYADVLRQVAADYGITAEIDDSVDRRDIRFDLDNVAYAQAMNVLLAMTHAFAVPLDVTSIIIARSDPNNRQRLEPQLEETIYVPGYTTEQINELVTLAKNIFNVQKIDAHPGNIVVRAPEAVLNPLNRTLENLIDASGEVMIEVRLYEVNRTHMTDIGSALPTQFSVFNVDQAANQIVNQNQALVQQAISQGLVPPGTSNLLIALALIKLGLVQSNLATNLIGVFGGGALMTGLSGPTSTTFNFGLNSTDTRALDDVQQRVGDRQPAVFREGTKYPIVTATYTSGLSTAASALGNATINGVSVASLLQQFAGGSSATIPQVTYEDLGVTLKATPKIERTGLVNLSLDLSIEALSGSTNDGNPILDSRQFSSGITVGDGESVLMASNVSRTELAAMSGIPGLSELPGFQMPTLANVEHDSRQLVLLITPHILRKPPDLLMSPRILLQPQAVN